MAQQKIILTDRSRIVARQECPRLRYLNYHFQGTGIQRKAGSLPLIDGIILHEGFARLFMGSNLDATLALLSSMYQDELKRHPVHGKDPAAEAFLLQEQSYLISGILRTWAYHRLPSLLEEYEVIAVEQEFPFHMADGLEAMMRMDAILRRKDDGLLHIWDAKTLQFPSSDWMRKWEHDDQWLMYILAAEQHFKEPFGGVLVEGIVKGAYKTDTAQKSPFSGKKIQQSPYCYGYKLPGGEEVGSLYQTSYTSKKGWEKVSATNEMSAKEWFENVLLPESRKGDGGFSLNDQFIIVPPICPSKRERERWLQQQVFGEIIWARRVEEIENAKTAQERQELLDCYAPMNHGRCLKYGLDHACQFEDGPCFNETIEADPIGSGLYEPRVPHHEGETQVEEAA